MVVELPPDLGVYWWRISAANMGQTRVFARIRQLFVYYLSVLIIYILILLFSDLQHCFSTCFTLEDYDLGMCEGAHCGTSGAELCVQVWIREDLLIIASLGVTGSKSKVRLSVTHTSVIVVCDSSAERNLKKCKPYGRSFLKSAGLKIFASAPGARGDVHHGSPDGFCRKRGLDSDYGTIGLYYWYNFSVCLKATYVLS